MVSCSPKPELKFIFETDMGNDIDDALALALINKAYDKGEFDFIGVCGHKLSASPAIYMDIVNNYYGHKRVPIAMGRRRVNNFQLPDYSAAVTELRNDDNSLTFKRTRKTEDFLDGVTMYRQLLAKAKDQSVVIASVGFAPTIADLINSQPDKYSPLTGKELIAAKVKYINIMAGSYGDNKRKEYNVVNDVPSMQTLVNEITCPVIQNPFELGKMVLYPQTAVDERMNEDNPVAVAYKWFKPNKNTPAGQYDRPSWDLLSVAYVLAPEMFTISAPGRITVDDEGYTYFEEDQAGTHYVLSLTEEQAAALKEYLVNNTVDR